MFLTVLTDFFHREPSQDSSALLAYAEQRVKRLAEVGTEHISDEEIDRALAAATFLELHLMRGGNRKGFAQQAAHKLGVLLHDGGIWALVLYLFLANEFGLTLPGGLGN